VQPFGPSAPIKDLHVGNTRYNDKIEKAYYDTDLHATNAVVDLYARGVMVSKIQKAFSVGAFGIEKKRRLVPTRWSITAVDDIISKSLMAQVKTFPEITSIECMNQFTLTMSLRFYCYPSSGATNPWRHGTPEPYGTPTDLASLSTATGKETTDEQPMPQSEAAIIARV